MNRHSIAALRIAQSAALLMAAAMSASAGGCQRTQAPEPGEAPRAEESSQQKGQATADDGQTVAEAEGQQAATAELGRKLYLRHCGGCHGENGDGRGVAAPYLFPKPRDFSAGRFRLVSTANNVPSRKDLLAVLQRGMPGSAMPPWPQLSPREREALVDEVMRLRREGARAYYIRILKEEEELSDDEIAAPEVQEEIEKYVKQFTTPGQSTEVPEIGEPTPERIARAKEAYAKFGCAQCHGKQGKGDGVKKMIDSEGLPTAPRDFTAGIFKGGDDPASLYRRIAYGMPGTPMPSSQQQMPPEVMVDLVHYILSMSTEAQRKAAVLNREQIVVQARDSLPSDASDSAWSDVPAASLRMTPLWWRNDADPDFRVQAVHDGQNIVIRLSWKDEQQDLHAASSGAFEDGVAVELYRGEEEPFLGMGMPQEAVDVWYWDADRQGKPMRLEDLYPNAVVDVYPFSEVAVVSAELDREGARLEDQPDISLPARASGNQIVPTADESGASALAAAGPGTVTFRLPHSQVVEAIGSWQDGRWTVVMKRPLKVDSPDDGLSLAPGDHLSAAFAVWDGAFQDRDGKKLITIWQDFVIENQP